MSTLDLGELVAHTRVDNDGLRRDLAQGEVEMRASGSRMGRSITETAIQWANALVGRWRGAGRDAADGFWQDANGRWHNQLGRFVKSTDAFSKAAGGAANNGLQMFSTGLGNASTGATNLSTNLWNLIPIILGVVAALAAIGPVGALAGGILGSLPALATGGLAAVGALGLGVVGLADAFKESTAAGGSFVDRARQIMLAQRRVRDANEEVLASQLALTRAQEDASERLEDLNRNLAGARLDQSDAQAALARAQRDLERAQEGDNEEQILAAARAYQRAQWQLEEVQDRVGDLEREQTRAAVKGVQGSDEVTDALRRQRVATEGLEDAHYELRRAQLASAGGGGAAAEVTKIAASATAAVAAIKALRPVYESLRLDIQERLFSGSDTVITGLVGAWEPTLRARLGGMAAMFNNVFKQWAATSAQPEFIFNISTAWLTVERLIGRVAGAIVGPGLDAFGRLSRAAEPFVDLLGDRLARGVENFANWIAAADDTGELEKFFERSADWLGDVFDLGGIAIDILTSLIGIMFRAEDRNPGKPLDGLKAGLQAVADWLDDPANQDKVASWFGKIEDAVLWIKNEAIPTVKGWAEDVKAWADRLDGWATKVESFRIRVANAFDNVKDAIVMLRNSPADVFGFLRDSFRAALNWIIGRWNNLGFDIPQLSFMGATIGGGRIDTPDIPYLAHGGLVRATPGGRPVVMAEAGEDEIASPVSMMRRIVAEELARVQREQHRPMVVENHIHVGDEVVRVVRTEVDEHDRRTRRGALAGSGTR